MQQRIEVPGSVTVRSAAAFRETLLAAMEAGQDIELDCAELAELDLAFLQIVCAARVQLAQSGQALRLAAPASAAMAALLDRAGFLADPAPADLQFWFHGELPQ